MLFPKRNVPLILVRYLVGDKKLGSLSNLGSIVEGGDYYLTPLSKVQVNSSQVLDLVIKARKEVSKIRAIFIDGKEIGEGFEVEHTYRVCIEVAGKEKVVSWAERRMVVRIWKQVGNQKATVWRRIEKAKLALKELLVKKQGKQTLENEFAIQEKIDLILQELKVEDYFDIKIHRHTTIKKKRKYGDNPARTIQEVSFSLEVQVKQSEIDQAIQNLGWLIYATNAPKQSLPRTLGELTLNDALSI